jgi:hypothetical protein
MPNNDPVQIRSIDGLGPVKADISSTPFATGRGELYQGASTGKRNIILTLGLNPDWVDHTMSSLRQLLYRYFMVESWVTMRFFTDDHPLVTITGNVESFEPNIFAQDPEIQISILCPKPDFVEVDTTLIKGIVDKGESVTVIDYEGTVPTGFELRVMSTPDLDSYFGVIVVENQISDEEFRINAVTVDTSQYLRLNTVKTTRFVHTVVIADGSEVNILARMEKVSDWPALLPGKNELSVRAISPGQKWTMGYFNRFGGL